jgi:hypothetical protein
MGGKPRDPGYWKRWRAAHPEYRERQRELKNRRRAENGREDRSREYAKERERRAAARVSEPALPELFPDLVPHRRTTLLFRDEDLRRDLRQVRELALLEGTNVLNAVRSFARREREWIRMTTHLIDQDSYEDFG